MKRRFTTLLVAEQLTDNENSEIDQEILHDQIIDAVQSDTHGTEVIAIKTIVERWDPENDRWEVVE